MRNRNEEKRNSMRRLLLMICLVIASVVGAQAQVRQAQKTKWKTKPVKEYKQAQPKTDDGHDLQTFYVGLGYMVEKMGGLNIMLGTAVFGHDLQLSYKLGLQKSDDLYWYDRDGRWQTSVENYKQHSVDLRYGYRFEFLKQRVMATPQLGLRLHFLSGSVSEGGENYGGGSMATSLSLGGRLSVKVADHVHVYVTPEYGLALSRDHYFKQVEDWDGCKVGGFTLGVGMMVRL